MTTTEVAPGARFGVDGRYRLERMIGAGGTAFVWLAHDARLGREVAVKVLSDVLALDADFVARFEREARLAAKLSHPHLVEVLDFSVDGPRPYLVMEYIAGGTLADRVGKPQPGSLGPVELAGGLLAALAYVHAAGILHRDIKPANVLIGVDGRVRLTDFGIAQPSDATRITGTGLVIGTRRYIAPEILRGEPATVRSDLYSCGVLLRECVGPHAPPELLALVDALTAEHPRGRPRSAAAAAAALADPVPAHPIPAQLGPTAPTRFLARPAGQPRTRVLSEDGARAGRLGRLVGSPSPRPLAATVAGVAALAVSAVLLTGGTHDDGAPRPAPVPPTADQPLAKKLDRLDQMIERAHR